MRRGWKEEGFYTSQRKGGVIIRCVLPDDEWDIRPECARIGLTFHAPTKLQEAEELADCFRLLHVFKLDDYRC